MSHQNVFRLPSKGAGYNALKEKSEPIPKVAPHEVLLQIHATALNYRDLAIANGGYPFPVKDDLVPLSNGAGTIIEIGSDVKGIEKDDWALCNFDVENFECDCEDPGDHQVELEAIGGHDWHWNHGVEYGNIPLKPGQTVLFQGTGGLSMTALVLARAAGAITIITSSSDEKLKLAKEKYGVDHTINSKTTLDWDKEALKTTNEYAQSLSCIARGGITAVVGFLNIADEMPDVAGLVLGSGAIVRGIRVGAKQMAEDMVKFVCEKNLDMPVEKTFGFSREQVIEAYNYLEAAGHVGKI